MCVCGWLWVHMCMHMHMCMCLRVDMNEAVAYLWMNCAASAADKWSNFAAFLPLSLYLCLSLIPLLSPLNLCLKWKLSFILGYFVGACTKCSSCVWSGPKGKTAASTYLLECIALELHSVCAKQQRVHWLPSEACNTLSRDCRQSSANDEVIQRSKFKTLSIENLWLSESFLQFQIFFWEDFII